MENPADNPRDFTTTAQDDLVGEGVNPLLDHLLCVPSKLHSIFAVLITATF